MRQIVEKKMRLHELYRHMHVYGGSAVKNEWNFNTNNNARH